MKPINRVIYNTGIVYIKLLLTILVGLFTTRLILNALGKTDYGIYSLVAGVIGMLSFLNTSMSIASMRFMAHSLGSGNMVTVKKTFNTSLIIHIFLGFFVLILMEVGGLLMFKYWLNIPADRIYDAKIIFHFMVLSTFVAILSVPFDAVINAHENFLAIALIDLFGSIVNLGIAIYITMLHFNLLITYGLLILLNQIMLRLIKQWYSRSHYEECKIRLKEFIDRTLIKSILSFASWNVLASSGAIIIMQTKGILLNMFFGVNLNASNGIADTLTSQLNNFSSSLTQAINPQIMKSEGGGQRSKMLQLTVTAAKFSVFLFSVFSIPVFIEAPYLLKLWLKNVPDFVVIFSRLMILTMILEKFTFPIITAINAIGKIKEITIVGLISISMTIPIGYFLFWKGMPPQSIYFVGLFISLCTTGLRLYYGKKLAGIDISEYIKMVIVKSSLPLLITALLTSIPYFLLEESLYRLVLTTFVSMAASAILIRYLGLTKDEFIKLRDVVMSILNRFKNNKK